MTKWPAALLCAFENRSDIFLNRRGAVLAPSLFAGVVGVTGRLPLQTVFRLTDFCICVKVLKITFFHFLILSPPYDSIALRV
jgi:hypothetical protein